MSINLCINFLIHLYEFTYASLLPSHTCVLVSLDKTNKNNLIPKEIGSYFSSTWSEFLINVVDLRNDIGY